MPITEDHPFYEQIEGLSKSQRFYMCYEQGVNAIHCGSITLFDKIIRDHHNMLTKNRDSSLVRNSEKIFGIGLNKTGTWSLAVAMNQLGYSVYHEPPFLDRLYDFDFCNDTIVAGRFDFLDQVFPNAKFILTIRDIDSWVISIEKWWKELSEGRLMENGKRNGYNMVYDPLSAAFNRYLIYNDVEYDRENYIKKYNEHVEKVKNCFKGREDKLLIMNICGGDEWKPLCNFLNKDFPEKPFPHANKTAK